MGLKNSTPPPIVLMGPASGVGWCWALILRCIFRVSVDATMWIIPISMIFIILGTDHFTSKLSSRLGWTVGLSGWMIGFLIMWLIVGTDLFPKIGE